MLTCLGGGVAFSIIASVDLQEAITPHGPRWPWILVTFGVAGPLSFLRSMDTLRFTSMAALAALLYTTLIVILYSCGIGGMFDPFGQGAAVGKAGEVVAFSEPLQALRALASISSAFSCHFNIPSIQAEMDQPTRPRIWTWYGGSFGFALCLYLIVALCGYATYGSAVSSNILTMYPKNGFTTAARIAISLVVIFSCAPTGL